MLKNGIAINPTAKPTNEKMNAKIMLELVAFFKDNPTNVNSIIINPVTAKDVYKPVEISQYTMIIT